MRPRFGGAVLFSYLALACLPLACLLLTGCDDVLTSVKFDQPAQDDRLLGKWNDFDDPKNESSIVVERNGSGYRVKVAEPDKPEEILELVLMRVDGVLFGQSPEKCSDHEFSYPGDPRQCYRIYRVDLGTNEFTLSEPDVARFVTESEARRVEVDHRIARTVTKAKNAITCVLIEGSLADLRTFLGAYPKDGFKPSAHLRRAPAAR